MTTHTLRNTAQADRTQPTAEDMAHATPIVTWETIAVCGTVTVLPVTVLNIIGANPHWIGVCLISGVIITALVIRGNAQVRRFSIENAVEDRLGGCK